MSYKNKKLKKGKLNQFRRIFRLVKIAFLKKQAHLKIKKGGTMRLEQTQKIMEALRMLNRVQGNKKIDEWVDNYVNDCVLNGKSVEILLQWCSGLGLAMRMDKQGGQFVPLPAEISLIQEQIPQIIKIFTEQSVRVSWIITFNRSYIERRRLSDKPFFAYIEMIRSLAFGIDELDSNVLFYDWDELAVGGIKPNKEILERFDEFVGKNAMQYEIKTFLQMLKQFPDSLSSEEELICEAKRRIAFESEEARYLVGPESPFSNGDFILIPLEKPERYVFFDIFAKGFKKRITSVTKLYPWRFGNEN